MQTTSLRFDCTIEANTPQQVDSELDGIRSRAMAFFAATGDGQTATPAIKPPRARAARARRQPATRRRAGNGAQKVSDDQFRAAVALLGGASAVAIAEQTGLSHNQTLRRLGEMEKTGGVYREGARSSTRWFAREPVIA